MATMGQAAGITGPGIWGRLARSVEKRPGDWMKLTNNIVKFQGEITTSRREAAACSSFSRRMGVATNVVDATRFPKAVWNFMNTVSNLSDSKSKLDMALTFTDATAEVTDATVKVAKALDATRFSKLRNKEQWSVAGNIAGAWMCFRGAESSLSTLGKEFSKEAVAEDKKPQVDLTATKIFSAILGTIKNVSRLALNIIGLLGATLSLIVPSMPMLILSTVGLVTSIAQSILKEEINFYKNERSDLLLPRGAVV